VTEQAGAPGALFDPIAELYEQYAEINDSVYRPYLEAALPARAARGVDLGCGSGRFTGLLARRCDSVLAVDISPREIALARARRPHENVQYRVGSLLEVAADPPYDLVLSVNTLFHLFGEHGPETVLPHVRSLVAPGGWAVIVDVVSPGARPLWWHRWWGVQDAVRTLRRRRSVRDARTVLRLRQHPVWMTHARVNQPLRREEFRQRYARLFPGAEFTSGLDPFICAMRWHNAAA
jgi:SAM-dependent methyltransferase